MYTHPGFGPQFSENYNPPGPGNEYFNAFDVSRVYLNLYFTPTDDLLFRFTPELYRANGNNGSPATNNTQNGRNTAPGPDSGGENECRERAPGNQEPRIGESNARARLRHRRDGGEGRARTTAEA